MFFIYHQFIADWISIFITFLLSYSIIPVCIIKSKITLVLVNSQKLKMREVDQGDKKEYKQFIYANRQIYVSVVGFLPKFAGLLLYISLCC